MVNLIELGFTVTEDIIELIFSIMKNQGTIQSNQYNNWLKPDCERGPRINILKRALWCVQRGVLD